MQCTNLEIGTYKRKQQKKMEKPKQKGKHTRRCVPVIRKSRKEGWIIAEKTKPSSLGWPVSCSKINKSLFSLVFCFLKKAYNKSDISNKKQRANLSEGSAISKGMGVPPIIGERQTKIQLVFKESWLFER